MERSARKRIAMVVAGLTAASAGVFALFAASAAPAFADSQPFEVYCPGTPVGNIVLNGAVATGTISPATPAAGQQFNVTNFQTTVDLPNAIASAAQALGNSAIVGTATVKVDATGATPASLSAGTIQINTPLPSPIPASGIPLLLPSPPTTVGPFTASGGAVSLTIDPAISLSLTVSGSALNLTCKPYPNNTAPSGISSSAPSGATATPVVASTSSSGAAPAATTATTAAPSTTAAAPASPSTSSLASTGPGPHLWVVAVVGFIVLYLGSVALALVERPRSLLRRVLQLVRVPHGAAARVAGSDEAAPAPAMVTSDAVLMPVADSAGPSRSAGPPTSAVAPRSAVAPAYPSAGGSKGLWFDGWEPPERT
jgi:DNA segregation ATPase FtsK/SpoIIIE, S-DNA-T family